MNQSNTTFLVELTEENDPAPVAASIHSFLRFSSDISLALDELELRWSHMWTKHSTRPNFAFDASKARTAAANGSNDTGKSLS